ncbi:MAG: CHAT domain-containing protein, partial [Halothece sp.]
MSVPKELFGNYQILASVPNVDFSANLMANSSSLTSEDSWRNEAILLTRQGYDALDIGKAKEALEFWKEAETIYRKQQYQEGIKGSQINQSLALRSLGLSQSACLTLLTALNLNSQEKICSISPPKIIQLPFLEPSLVNAIGLRNLGDTLRSIGNIETANQILQKSWEIVNKLNSSSEKSQVLLSWGNTQQSLYHQRRNLYQRTRNVFHRENAIATAKVALDYYTQTSQLSETDLIQVQAQLNQLNLLLDLSNWLSTEVTKNANLKQELAILEKQTFQTLSQLQNQTQINNLPLTQSGIYAQINFAKVLSEVNYSEEAIAQGLSAVERAKLLNDKRTESYALGILGHLYEKQQLLSQAQNLTEQALILAQSILAKDISYQWQWQLGRIYQQQDSLKKAGLGYQMAIADLKEVRQDLLTINPNLQFSFRENVEPVYREYLELLLQPNAAQNALERAIQVTEALQIAELENFLRCNITEASFNNIQKQPAAIIYPLFLKERIAVILKLPQSREIKNYDLAVSVSEFESKLYNLQTRLSNNERKELILPLAQQIYNWLIQPIASQLPKEGTLVFVPDKILQNIPLSVLFDGEQYLIEKYSIATNLGLPGNPSNLLSFDALRVLLAGVSEKADSFSTELPILPYVDDELESINAMISGEKLLNRAFTTTAFENTLKKADFPIIHLATHGQFSSDPGNTLIYAWNQSINVNQFNQLLRQGNENRQNPIELLVLSACETAKGDERAGLGIAGIALKAEISSVLASLWQVNDGSTPEFMRLFYQALKQPNITKAEALRQAQISFIHDDYLPYDWAGFILAGSW